MGLTTGPFFMLVLRTLFTIPNNKAFCRPWMCQRDALKHHVLFAEGRPVVMTECHNIHSSLLSLPLAFRSKQLHVQSGQSVHIVCMLLNTSCSLVCLWRLFLFYSWRSQTLLNSQLKPRPGLAQSTGTPHALDASVERAGQLPHDSRRFTTRTNQAILMRARQEAVLLAPPPPTSLKFGWGSWQSCQDVWSGCPQTVALT